MTQWDKIGYVDLTDRKDSGKTQIGKYGACCGVSSKLENKSGYVKGHILQMDIDDFDGDINNLFSAADLPDGVYFVTKTNDDSYNITSFNLFSWREVVAAKAKVTLDDAEHLKVGIKRGYWILRLSGKAERDRPQFESFKVLNDNDRDFTYSIPHIQLYAKLYRDVGLYDLLPEGEEATGSLNLEHYATPVE